MQLQGLQTQLAAAGLLHTSSSLPGSPHTDTWSHLTASEGRNQALMNHVTSAMDPRLYLAAKEAILREFWSGFESSLAANIYEPPDAQRSHYLQIYHVKVAHAPYYPYSAMWEPQWLLPKVPESLRHIVLDKAATLQHDLDNMGFRLDVTKGQLEKGQGIVGMGLAFDK